jgi:SAM-dependent methyltransferase
LIEGILDLRTAKTALSANEALFLAHPNWDYPTMIREVFRRYNGPLADYYAAYQLDESRGERMVRLFASADTQPHRGVLLDVACGSGVLLEAESRLADWVVGVDVLLEQLLYARRRLRDRGIDNIILICADAYDLPLFPNTADSIWSLNTLEHLLRLDTFFEGIAGILKQNGVFVGDSRNRYDLFFPEPHLRLRWVGFLPRHLQWLYITLRQGKSRAEAYAEDTRLRSLYEIRALARRYFRQMQVGLPDISAYGMPHALAPVVNLGEHIPVLGGFMRLVFPTYLISAKK